MGAISWRRGRAGAGCALMRSAGKLLPSTGSTILNTKFRTADGRVFNRTLRQGLIEDKIICYSLLQKKYNNDILVHGGAEI